MCATTCVRAHAGYASGTETRCVSLTPTSRDLDLPRDERPTNKRYSVVEFTGLVQVQMSPQRRTLRHHSNRDQDVLPTAHAKPAAIDCVRHFSVVDESVLRSSLCRIFFIRCCAHAK